MIKTPPKHTEYLIDSENDSDSSPRIGYRTNGQAEGKGKKILKNKSKRGKRRRIDCDDWSKINWKTGIYFFVLRVKRFVCMVIEINS